MPSTTREAPVGTVTVQTLLKGEVEVDEKQIIQFIGPLLGFDQLKRFIIYQTQPGPIYWLQSLENPEAAFCLLAPFEMGLDPDIEIGAEDAIDIEAGDEGEIVVYTVVVLDEDPTKVRTNLRAPILLGRNSGKAKQVVLNNPRLPIQFYLNRAAKASDA